MSIKFEKLSVLFKRHFGTAPQWFARAPGRVNLIGEHTDYNGGFVLPCAINRDIAMAAAPGSTGKLRLFSVTLNEKFETDVAFAKFGRSPLGWANYFLAVVEQFKKRGVQLPLLDVAIDGDVPLGAGLSSSAAFEVCAAVLIQTITGATLDGREIALLCQAAEHSPLVGVQCGIMDQFASVMGREGFAIFLDCYSLEHRYVPIDGDRVTIIIANSMVKRGLVDSAYNERREECETALALLSDAADEKYPTLRHIPREIFETYAHILPVKVRRRARHVITENARVEDFEQALIKGALEEAGRLLNASHASLRDDFEVSCAELDALCEIAEGCEGIYGCRMTGAGFGGCVVALAQPDAADAACDVISEKYLSCIGKIPDIYLTPACAGAKGAKIDKNT